MMAKEVIGKKYSDIHPREYSKAMEKNIEEVLSTGEVKREEIRFSDVDRWSSRTYSLVIDAETEDIDGVVVVSKDTTESKQAEEKLKESEERFKALHNASFGGIAIHDKGVILECNLGLSEISGFSRDELIGADGVELLIAQESHETVMNNIRSGYEKSYEVLGLRKNGEKYPVRLEARQIPYKGKM